MRVRLEATELGALLRPASRRRHVPSAIERSVANGLKVLAALADFGALTCADLAAACWPRTVYGEQMAQRTVRALLRAGQVAERTSSLGTRVLVLTRPGAAALEVRGTAAHHGLDLAVGGANYRHSALTAAWCIRRRLLGFDVYTERAIASGRAPVSREVLFKRFGKHADAALIRGDNLYLCETESAPKGSRQLMRICAIAERVGRRVDPEGPLALAGVFVLFDADENHGARVAKAANELWKDRSPDERERLAGRILLSRVALRRPLVWLGCVDERLCLAR